MKKHIQILIVLGFVITTVFPANAIITDLSVEVEGVECMYCAHKLSDALKDLKFIEDVKINNGARELALVTRANKKFDVEDLRKSIKKSGFEAGKITLTVSGKIISDTAGFYYLESSSDKSKFSLFDKENQYDFDTTYWLEPMYLGKELADKVVKAKKQNKTVTVKGEIHDHIGLQTGLLIEEIEIR